MTADHVGAPDQELVAILAEYLPGQRWFAAKGQDLPVGAFRVVHRTVVARDFHETDVEQVLCPSPDAGKVLVADLTKSSPTFVSKWLYQVPGVLGAIVAAP